MDDNTYKKKLCYETTYSNRTNILLQKGFYPQTVFKLLSYMIK